MLQGRLPGTPCPTPPSASASTSSPNSPPGWRSPAIGARTRESPIARCELALHQLHDIEAHAAASTEKMGAPVAFLVIGFVLLIGYPAFSTILQL